MIKAETVLRSCDAWCQAWVQEKGMIAHVGEKCFGMHWLSE